MKKIFMFPCVMILYFCLAVQPVAGQGYGGELGFTGLSGFSIQSAAGRSMGGMTVGIRNEAGLMFHNPASLRSVQGIQISAGGFYSTRDQEQVQHYAPVRYFPNLSLLLESLTHLIPDPDPSYFGFTQQDSVQRPYDDIAPNWSHSEKNAAPLRIMVSIPFSVGGTNFTAGLGLVQYSDMNHFYQNNNVLSPPVLAQRPLPAFRPTDDAPVDVDWSQSIRSREGSIMGYGAAIAGSFANDKISLGVSGMLLSGSTDDMELYRSRGTLVFFSNSFRLDSTYSRITRTGTSDYDGMEFTVSGIYHNRYMSIGFSAKLPNKIKRSYLYEVSTDTSGTPVVSSLNGKDEFELPWRGTVGLMIHPRENLTLGLEYEVRPYSSAVYKSSDGTESSPWLSSSVFRIGAEFALTPWLSLRGGMQGNAEVFEQEGNPVSGSPVRYEIYSAGFGITAAGLRFNIAYENTNVKYQDIWGSAISKNETLRHSFMAEIAYQIPWGM